MKLKYSLEGFATDLSETLRCCLSKSKARIFTVHMQSSSGTKRKVQNY